MAYPEYLNGKEITIAGIVSSAKVLTSKNGNFYGRLTIEDFTDSFEMTLFGKEFENNRKFFYEGYPLLIKGRFEQRRFKEGEIEFSVKSITMLSDVRNELVKKITITIMADELTDELVDTIKRLTSTNNGKVQLYIRLVDPECKTSVEMFSRTYRVNITNEIIDQLKKLQLNFKVN